MSLSTLKKAVCLAALGMMPLFAGAEDIDLFQGGTELTGNSPNILIVLDNSANWSRNDQQWPGGIKQGEAELSALAKVLERHQGDLRIGLMMFTEGQQTNGGGYVRFGIRNIEFTQDGTVNGTTNAAKLKAILDGIRPRFDNPVEKVSAAQANYSNVMYEAYRYFGGMNMYASPIDNKRDYSGNGAYNVSPYTAGNVPGNALSGSGATQYQSPLGVDAPCSKNYIIFIGNGYPSRDSDPSSYGDTRVNQLFNKGQLYAAKKINYADEWARFLKDHGVEATCTGTGEDRICVDGTITTYTIDVYNAKQDLEQTQLLKSMAAAGGGDYFAAKSETDIIGALNTILNDVQAVDSVFTSASLPVSVNTQGTYLNQIYMGVFRPEEGGRPRWMGNLKQYRFGITTDAAGRDQLYLADSTQDNNGKPNPAVNMVTGFVKPDAVSYWSTKNTSDPFWSFRPKGVGGMYDAPDGDLVEKGGAAQKLRELRPNRTEVATVRKMLTCTQLDGCTSSSLENFSTANSSLVAKINSVGGNTSLIDWIRGKDNRDDENFNNAFNDVRASIHGDVLHSRPLVINYGDTKGLVAFYGSNDGTLRAVKAGNTSADGSELWSFVSSEHYGALGRLYNNQPLIKYPNTPEGLLPEPTKRNYYFDGNIGVYQSANLETTQIFVSMRRGGRAIYALDVSNPQNPAFMWKRSHRSPGFSELGLTFSEPKVAAIKSGNAQCNLRDPSTYRLVLIFGAGYDAAEEDKLPGQVRAPQMGRGVFVLDATSGNIVKFLEPTNSGTKYSFAADVTLLDTDSDACIDRLYAVDTGGNIHRYDLSNADPSVWPFYHVAQLGDIEGDGGSNDRKFLYPVDPLIGYEGTSQVTYLMGGTGDRESPRDTTVQNHFFMIKDTLAANQTGTLPAEYPRKLADLQQVTVFDPNSPQAINPYAEGFKGWYLPLAATGEKAVNAPLTVAGVTYFGTNIPKAASNQCTPNLGEARGYALNFLNGTAAAGDRDQNGSVGQRDLYANFIGGGLPPSPVTGVVKVDSKYVRFVIGSGGTGNESSAIQGHQVQANPNSNRTRVYWYFKKD